MPDKEGPRCTESCRSGRQRRLSGQRGPWLRRPGRDGEYGGSDGRSWAGHTFPRALGDGRGDLVAVVDALLEAVGDALGLLVDLEVLCVLRLLVRLQAVVLAGRVEGRHG